MTRIVDVRRFCSAGDVAPHTRLSCALALVEGATAEALDASRAALQAAEEARAGACACGRRLVVVVEVRR